MIRLTIIILILTFGVCRIIGGEVDARAQGLLTEGNAALAQSDRDPSQNLVAALAFAKALPAYESAGDLETAAEIKSVIFWCKKRMDLGTLQRFVANKGEDGEVLTAAVAQVEQPVAVSEAKDYLAKAESYAQKNGGQHLKIAIRYFEVADRFQGTPESLQAQRLSLEAMQRNIQGARVVDPKLSADLHADAIQAGDLPDAAKKLVDQSNQAVDALAGKASQDLGQNRRRATDVILKEAEAAQKRGSLDEMTAHQNQAADVDREVSGLSKAASAAIDAYRKARAKGVAKTSEDILAERKKLVQSLGQIQKEETKNGNTAGALAVKALVQRLEQENADRIAEAAVVNAKREPIGPQKTLKERLVGAFKYDFKNGHAGTLNVQKNSATLAGFTGSVSQEKDKAVISWNNGTQWTITEVAGELVVNASDGTAKLIPVPVGVHSSKDVILYNLPNFKGNATTVKTFGTIIDAYTVGFPNDGLRSIKVPRGVVVIVYEGDLGGGKSYEITSDMEELTSPIALGMTSFRLEKRPE